MSPTSPIASIQQPWDPITGGDRMPDGSDHEQRGG